MPAYVIAAVGAVRDVDALVEYRRRNTDVVDAHGGRFIARGGDIVVLEGDWTPARVVIIEFPDMEAARGWHESDDYAPLRELRQGASDTDILVVDGRLSRRRPPRCAGRARPRPRTAGRARRRSRTPARVGPAAGDEVAAGLDQRRERVDRGDRVHPARQQAERHVHRREEQHQEHRHLHQRPGLHRAQAHRHAGREQRRRERDEQRQHDEAEQVDAVAADLHARDQRDDEDQRRRRTWRASPRRSRSRR